MGKDQGFAGDTYKTDVSFGPWLTGTHDTGLGNLL